MKQVYIHSNKCSAHLEVFHSLVHRCNFKKVLYSKAKKKYSFVMKKLIKLVKTLSITIIVNLLIIIIHNFIINCMNQTCNINNMHLKRKKIKLIQNLQMDLKTTLVN